jgi:hypothetical protein
MPPSGAISMNMNLSDGAELANAAMQIVAQWHGLPRFHEVHGVAGDWAISDRTIVATLQLISPMD